MSQCKVCNEWKHGQIAADGICIDCIMNTQDCSCSDERLQLIEETPNSERNLAWIRSLPPMCDFCIAEDISDSMDDYF